MPSIHQFKSIKKAAERGAFAANEAAWPLWELSKREILEVAIRLGAQLDGECDTAETGVAAVERELEALRHSNII